MAFDFERRGRIFGRTNGCCHICGKSLAFENYGKLGSKGAWQVEHSRPRATGGTDHLNNLFAACIPCNNAKGTVTSRSARAWNGRKRAPLSAERRQAAKSENAAAGAFVGGLLGLVAGPVGALAGALLGGALGEETDPEAENRAPKRKKRASTGRQRRRG